MTALTFNVSAFVGLVLMFAGVWLLLGVGAALVAAGAYVWITTILLLLLTGARWPRAPGAS